MRRMTLLVLAAALLAGCYHDNASPFVHGAKNDPMATGGTMVPPATNVSEESTTTIYDSSSGRAGGVRHMPPASTTGQ